MIKASMYGGKPGHVGYIFCFPEYNPSLPDFSMGFVPSTIDS
ncbi:MAG: hypothetical protein RLZZ226_150 [Pseudomonadota bacterium]|jgi:hypothetical protein